MVVDPRFLRQSAAKARGESSMMGPGSSCGRCGYDVTGLPMAGRCPECGTPFGGDVLSMDPPADSEPSKPRGPRKSASQLRALPVLSATDEDLRLLARAATLMQVGLVGFALAMLAGWVFIVLRSQLWIRMDLGPFYAVLARYGAAAVLALLIWAAGQWLLTVHHAPAAAGTPSPFANMRTQRVRSLALLSRASPWAWLLVLATIGVSMLLGGPSDSDGKLVGYIASALVLLAGASMIPVCLALYDIAEFLRDDFATARFRTGVFAVPILCGGYALSMLTVEFFALLSSGTKGFGGLLLFFLTGIMFVPIFPFFVGVCSLGSSCRWAIRNKHERIEREKRFLERARRAAAKAAGEPVDDQPE